MRNDNRNNIFFILLVIFHHQTNLEVKWGHHGFSLSRGLADEAVCSMQTLQEVTLRKCTLHDAFYQRVAEIAASSRVSKTSHGLKSTLHLDFTE